MTYSRDEVLAVAMLALLALLAAVMLAGCGIEVRAPELPKDNPLSAQVEKLTQERAEATKAKDAAIKTSADAKQAAKDADARAAEADRIGAEARNEAKQYRQQAEALRTAEIAGRISLVSWVLAGVGLLAALLGAFLVIRFPGKTSLCIALAGAGTLGLGLVGVWLAPHWIATVWGIAILLVLALVGGVVFLLRDHQKGLAKLWDKTQEEAAADPKLRKLLSKAGVKL